MGVDSDSSPPTSQPSLQLSKLTQIKRFYRRHCRNPSHLSPLSSHPTQSQSLKPPRSVDINNKHYVSWIEVPQQYSAPFLPSHSVKLSGIMNTNDGLIAVFHIMDLSLFFQHI